MQEENKNLKDSSSPTLPKGKGEGSKGIFVPPSLGGGLEGRLVSYTKTNKLISALYMVTDIMDTAEPIRNKLRTSGINIISDMSHPLLPGEGRGEVLLISIKQILSLLDIASAVGMISEMNYTILRKEFNELKQSIHEDNKQDNSSWLKGFLNSPLEEYPDLKSGGGGNLEMHPPRPLSTKSTPQEGNRTSIGRVGVQSGSTLMKAIENIKKSNGHVLSNGGSTQNNTVNFHSGFDQLKKQRREEILKIIKTCPQGATITDIKTLATGPLVSCGEKTLQRELVSMTQDGVLNKTGEKRWSRYSVVKSS